MTAQKKIANAIKVIMFKEDATLLKKTNIENDNIFLEPLFFCYFNNKKSDLFTKEILEEIIQGYFIKKEKLKIKYLFNKNNIAYIPQIGYFKPNKQKPFMLLEFIGKTNIEVIKCSNPLIDAVFKTVINHKIMDSELMICKELFNRNIDFLIKAFHFIKISSNEHFNLIQKVCKKIVLFKTDVSNTNSFATINAHGMVFFNVYQADYDEVFFVDDIAHQTGHVILTTLLFERKQYFLINENQSIGVITKKESEYRSFYTLFHALFTYYTSLLCLNNCLDNNFFNTRQTHETNGRICFYLNKLILDINTFKRVTDYFKGIEFVLTKDGIEIYNIMKSTFDKMIKKWYPASKNYDFKNQPYNFTYQEFIKLNPINNA